MVSVERLKNRLSKTLKARDLGAALVSIAELEQLEPKNPDWPKRAARLLHVTRDLEGQRRALRRALDLQIDCGLVLDAILSCQSILEIDPDDEESRNRLDDLLMTSGMNSDARSKSASSTKSKTKRRDQGGPRKRAPAASGPVRDAPLESIELNRMIPEARPIQIGDAEPGGVHEIPIDTHSGAGDSGILDLRLDAFASSNDLNDLVAAHAASLPARADLSRDQAAHVEPGTALRMELANLPLFGDLDPTSLHTLIRRVRVVSLEAGQILFREGDAANSLYVIVEGAVVPIAEGERRRKLAVLERGEFFGEIGVLTKQPRNATVEGLVDSQLLAIDRRVLWELIEKQPSVAKSILRFLRARLIDRQIRTNAFFAAFAHGERQEVARQFRVLEVAAGTRIVERGQPPDGLYVVLSGRLDLYDRDQDKSRGELANGDLFGGLQLLEGRPAQTDVMALSKCWLVVLGEARFRKILDANPRLTRVLKKLEAAKAERCKRLTVATV